MTALTNKALTALNAGQRARRRSVPSNFESNLTFCMSGDASREWPVATPSRAPFVQSANGEATPKTSAKKKAGTRSGHHDAVCAQVQLFRSGVIFLENSSKVCSPRSMSPLTKKVGVELT